MIRVSSQVRCKRRWTFVVRHWWSEVHYLTQQKYVVPLRATMLLIAHKGVTLQTIHILHPKNQHVHSAPTLISSEHSSNPRVTFLWNA